MYVSVVRVVMELERGREKKGIRGRVRKESGRREGFTARRQQLP